MDLIARSNDALKVNPVTGVDEGLTVHGSDWLWAVTTIYIMALVRNLPSTANPVLTRPTM